MFTGPGRRAGVSALALAAHVLFAWSLPRLLVLPIAIRSILIEPGAAMRRISLAIPGALLTTILAGHPVLALLILVSFLIGHVILPSTSATRRTSHTG